MIINVQRLRFVLFQTGPLAVVGSTLVVWPVLGHLLPPSEVGRLSAVLAWSSIFAPLATVGTHLYLSNRLARDASRAGGLDGDLARRVVTILAVLAICGMTALLAVPESMVLRIVTVVSSTGCSILSLGVIRGLNRSVLFASVTLWAQFLALLMMAVVAGATKSLDGGMITYSAALVVSAAVVPRLVKGSGGSWSAIRPWLLLRESMLLVPHLVLAVATLLVARIIVGAITGPIGLAGFQYSSLLIGGVTTIGASLDAHWSTRAQSAKDEIDLRAVLSRNLIRVQIILLLVAVAVVLFVLVFLGLWLPPKYDPVSVRTAVLLSLSAGGFQALADNRSAALMWLGRSGAVSFATIIGVIATTLTCTVLVFAFGWQAAGLAIVAGTACRAVVVTLALRAATGDLSLTLRSAALTAGCIAVVLVAAIPIILIDQN